MLPADSPDLPWLESGYCPAQTKSIHLQVRNGKVQHQVVGIIGILHGSSGGYIIGLILGDLLMVLIDPRISFGKKEGGR